MPGTVTLHRVFTAKPDKVYRAFVESDAVAAWLPPFGFTCTVEQRTKRRRQTSYVVSQLHDGEQPLVWRHVLEARPGGDPRSFDDPNLPGEVKVTVTLKAVPFGTEFTVVQEGLPDVMPVDGCYLGWQESLRKLAKLVEPEIAEE